MRHLVAQLRAFHHEEHGATMVEYGLMLALIALVCFLIITALGSNLRNKYDSQTLKNALS